MTEFLFGFLFGAAFTLFASISSIDSTYLDVCEKENNVYKCKLTAVPKIQEE